VPNPLTVPESTERRIDVSISRPTPLFLSFPLAAQKFVLCDFLMRASGDPGDLDFDDDKDKKELVAAASLVFEHSNELPDTYQTSKALEALCLSEFDTKFVDISHLDTLHETIGELLSIDEDGEVDPIISADKKAVLVAGIGVIEKQMNAASTPPTKEEPYISGPPEKVQRLD